MRKIRLLFISLFLAGPFAFAQYGYEWIDFDKPHYKVKVNQDGWYRISRSDLEAAGFPVSSISPDRIRMFRHGTEMAIDVASRVDNTVDYVEFFGEQNDARYETELYVEPDLQPHEEYSMFTDSASYFLTYSDPFENGRRITSIPTSSSSGLSPIQSHFQEVIGFTVSSFNQGDDLTTNNGDIYSSRYTAGEGYGRRRRTGQSETLTTSLTDVDFSSGQTPFLEVIALGDGEDNHLLTVQVGPNTSSLRTLGDINFSGYGHTKQTFNFALTDVDASGQFVVRYRYGGGQPRPAEVKIFYPQSLDLASDQVPIQLPAQIPDGLGWIQVSTPNAASTRLVDVTDPFNPVIVPQTNFSDRFEAVVPATEARRLVAVETPLPIGRIFPVNLSFINPAGSDYLVVTHRQLRQEINGQDPIDKFVTYRSSPVGGGHNMLVVHIRDLFNLFNYGDPVAPIALRKFIEFANDATTLNNVFIVGKGEQYIRRFYYQHPPDSVQIMTFGAPGGDNMYVEGLVTTDVPAVPIGRLSVTTAQEVDNYVEKVIEMEDLPFDELWRKDVLQLSGGENEIELRNFALYNQGFTQQAETDFLGGRVINKGKKTTDVVEFIDVTEEINAGVNLVTFFGHSSATDADIEIGLVSEPQYGFTNTGRYPIFLINGCNAGNIFDILSDSFGEDWMRTADLGAIGFIAHTFFATSENLRRYTELFYEVAFNDESTFGSSVGEVMVELADRYYSRYGLGEISKTQVLQTQLQGDPAVTVFGAALPDYNIQSDQINVSAVDDSPPLSSQDSVVLTIPISNFGRTVTDSLRVEVTRTLSDGSSFLYSYDYPRVLRLDSVRIALPNPTELDVSGLNTFFISIDPFGQIAELDESNNNVTLQVNILDGVLSNLFPPDYYVSDVSDIRFAWQTIDLTSPTRSFDFQLDTDPSFSSPSLITQTVEAEVLANYNWTPGSLSDTTTYFWRTRVSDPANSEEEEWSQSSFTLIPGGRTGFGLYHPQQVQENPLVGVEYGVGENWTFQTTNTPIQIQTAGVDATGTGLDNLVVEVNDLDLLITNLPIGAAECDDPNTVNAVFFDRETTSPYLPYEPPEYDGLSDFERNELCGRRPQVIYHLTPPGDLDFLVQGIQNMKSGDQVVLFNSGSVNYGDWFSFSGLITALESVGIQSATISSLITGQPFIALGTKGMLPGEATILSDNGGGQPLTEQTLSLTDNVSGSFISGQLQTRLIGPARSWNSFEYRIKEGPEDLFDVRLLGTEVSGQESELFSFTRGDVQDLTSVNPLTYPNLTIDFTFSDETNLTPPQFDFWQITYDLPPDGLLIPTDTSQIETYQGQPAELPYRFINYTGIDFQDSLDVRATLLNTSTGSSSEQNFTLPPISGGDSLAFVTAIPTRSQSGPNNASIQVRARENEQYTFNNDYLKIDGVQTQADNTNPIIDVTFDGRYILDGELVSSTPAIRIRLNDDNPYIDKTDTLGMQIDLRRPCSGCGFERINFADPIARVVEGNENQNFETFLNPELIEDGMYTLRVQARDAENNAAGPEPYEINFEVVNASTITHFYPYPNPFSTSTRFVFTLTGNKVPDRIKIQIMTISGRIVREISKAELGPIVIGNNLSEFAWDGTDEFGDQLANGVYFYRVMMEDDEETFDRRQTAGDRAFEKNFGKLYILR